MNKGTRKNIISAIITLLLIAGGVIFFQLMSGQKKSTVSDKQVKKERRIVKVSSFEAKDETNIIELDGRLQSVESVGITSKVSGVLQPGKSMRKGQFIKKGELMFSLDKREAEFNLKALKSSLMTSITQMMPDLKFDYAASFPTWESYLRNFDVNRAIPELPQPQNDQERYFLAARNIYNQYYSIKSQETRLSEYNIYAPFSGILTQVNVFPGSLVNPGASLATMINTSTYEIEAPVSLGQLKYIKPGQKVELSSSEMGKTWSGRVSRIGTQIDNATQNLPVYISASGAGLKDGMYLTGELKANTLTNVVRLPKSIFLSPTSIYVVQDSTLVSKEIESVKRMGNEVLVRGLLPDDKVVLGPLSGLFEGQKVSY